MTAQPKTAPKNPSATRFSDHTARAIDELVSHYPLKRPALIPSLHLVQKELGYVPESAQLQLAEQLGLPAAQVKEVVSFYTMFHTSPIGKCHIQVCRTLSCAMRGAKTLLHKLEEELHLEPGETSADGLFTVTTAECLASCGTAPAMLINDEFVENVDWPKLKKVIDQVRAGGTP